VMSVAALLIGLRMLPETLRTGSLSARRRWFDIQGLRTALKSPTVGLLILTFFLATLGFGSLESTLSLANKSLLLGHDETRELTREAARTTDRTNFLVFAYVGFVLMLIQGLIYRRLVPRVGEVRFMRLGTALMGLGMAGAVGVLLVRADLERAILYGVALAVMTIAVIGFAFLTPSIQSLISRRSNPATQGEILGVNQSAAAMARILGPIIGLSLFGLTPSHILPYAFGAGLLGLVFWITLRIQSQGSG